MGQVAVEETAFAHRDHKLMVNVVAMYMPGDERGSFQPWIDGLAGELQDREGAYSGFLGDEGEARVRAAYPAGTWVRLAEVKQKYDPENLFRLNQNITPSG